MISSRYSFEEFVNAVIHKNPEEVRDLAIKESDDVREILKSSGKNRSLGGTAQHYDHVLSGVALFVFQGGKPLDLDQRESEAFRRLCEAWVSRGQRHQIILEYFQ